MKSVSYKGYVDNFWCKSIGVKDVLVTIWSLRADDWSLQGKESMLKARCPGIDQAAHQACSKDVSIPLMGSCSCGSTD